MNAILFLVGGALVLYGLKQGGGLSALAGGLIHHGDTILPDGRPAQLSADQWATWKKTTISKYAGQKIAGGATSAADKYLGETEEAWYEASISTRQLQRHKDARGKWIPDQCGGASGPGSLLTATAKTGQFAGVATQATQTAGSLGADVSTGLLKSVPVIGSIVGAITFGIGIISQHHAQAVAKETADLCSLVPQANAALADIDSRFRSGQISSPQATAELENLYANFVAAAAPIITGGHNFNVQQNPSGACNAACTYAAALRMICDVREQLDY